MLTFRHLTLRRGPRVLFRDADFTIQPGWRVGITGANGSGKSSLLALIRGELEGDAGEVERPPNWVIAHLAQETPALDTPALPYVLGGDGELVYLNRELALAEADHDGARQALIHARLEAIGGHAANSRAARILRGLGFAPEEEGRPVASFSGGWRMRLNLGRALMCRSDLLMLDEPTNHLDLDTVIWLQEWLTGYTGTLLLISHDRDFLDEVADHVCALEGEEIGLFSGNYSVYERRRAERLAGREAAFRKQQEEIAHIQAFVERFRAKATKARQAQSRLKALARMELIAPAHVDSPFSFRFPEPERLPHPLLELERVAVGYGGHQVLREVTLSLGPGERLGLLGVNGAGKSTLIKLMAGELTPGSGRRTLARELEVAYFAQHQVEQLDPAASPLQHLQRLDPGAPLQELRNYLGGFNFVGEMALSPVAPFSGGEKARLVLALLVFRKPALLLLDEPTNHLDMEMRLALVMALQEYGGALVLVSHDRHLLRTVTERFWLVDGGRVLPFDGDLEAYRQWLAQRSALAGEVQGGGAGEGVGRETPLSVHGGRGRKELRRQEAERAERLRPLRKALARWEEELEWVAGELSSVEGLLADPALYGEGERERLQGVLERQRQLEQRRLAAEEGWFAAGAALEEADSDGEG